MSEPVTAKTKPVLPELEQLDFCMRMGEEPWEIESMVLDLALRATEELHLWLCAKGVMVPREVIHPFLASFFINTYLVNWAPSATVAKLNRPKLAEFFEPFSDSTFLDGKVYLSPFELLSLFFRFLEDIGYDLPLERLQRAIETVEREMRKAFAAQHAPGSTGTAKKQRRAKPHALVQHKDPTASNG